MASTAVAPPTPGYEITVGEVKIFCHALGLDPERVVSLHIQGKTVVANLTDEANSSFIGETIVVRIVTPREPKKGTV